MTHSQANKHLLHSFLQSSINPAFKGGAKVINFICEFYRVFAFCLSYIAFGKIHHFKCCGVASCAEVRGILSGVDLRPALFVSAQVEVKNVSVGALCKGFTNLHGFAPLSVANVGAVAQIGYGVNHCSPVTEGLGVFFGLLRRVKAFDCSACASSACSSKVARVVNAVLFVSIHLACSLVRLVSYDVVYKILALGATIKGTIQAEKEANNASQST